MCRAARRAARYSPKMRAVLVLLTVLLTCTTAAAEPAIDWAKGLVTADGVGIADRHAPSPAVARGTSRRGAEEAARNELAASVAQVRLASGGTVRTIVTPAIKARLDRAIAQAIAVTAQPETDGAWRVTMGVPIEAIRQAIEGGPRASDGGGDRDPAIVVVDGVTAKPAVGWTVGGQHVATIWVTAVPAWAKDAPHVKATSAKAGVIAVSETTGTEATLYVLLQP